MTKRNLFSELTKGLDEVKKHSQGKLTLRTTTIDQPNKISVSPNQIKKIRRSFNMSQAVFSRVIRVSKRTLEKWEQGETKPNEQAAALILLSKNKPEILDDLSRL